MFTYYAHLRNYCGQVQYRPFTCSYVNRGLSAVRTEFIKCSPTRVYPRCCIPRRTCSYYLFPSRKALKRCVRLNPASTKLLTRSFVVGQGGGKPKLWYWAVAGLLGYIFFEFLMSSTMNATSISWKSFVEEFLRNGYIEKIFVDEVGRVQVKVKNNVSGPVTTMTGVQDVYNFPLYLLNIPKVDDILSFEDSVREVEEQLGIDPANSVEIEQLRSSEFLRTLITLIFLYLMFRLASSAKPGDLFRRNFTKARFTIFDPLSGQTKGVKFSDVAGLAEAKQEVMEFVDYLKHPEVYKRLGAKVPKGALLLGPPGCGKTLLAKAVASEADVPFLSMNGSEFIEMIGGIGAARVRNLFSEAKKRSPCIIYIDEIDAIGLKRQSGLMDSGNSESEHTLNQLLAEMDGMASREGVVTLASTNRAEVLDGALLRPGRFDRHITIDLPTMDERREIFIQHLKSIRLEKEPDFYSKRLASLTPGFSGADIANICNEAALHAARVMKKVVTGDDLEYAVERVLGGMEKRTSALSPEEKHVVAYNEAGRALIGWLSEHGELMLKISVVPRTHQSVGWTQFSTQERYLLTKEELFDRMCMALGGRVAELLIFNKVSTKAEADLQTVTRISYAQIRHYGMNETVGPVAFEQSGEFAVKPYSKNLAALMDEEARKLVSKAFLRAQEILIKNKETLIKLAEELFSRETLNYNDVVDLIGPPLHASKRKIEPLAFEQSLNDAAKAVPTSTP